MSARRFSAGLVTEFDAQSVAKVVSSPKVESRLTTMWPGVRDLVASKGSVNFGVLDERPLIMR